MPRWCRLVTPYDLRGLQADLYCGCLHQFYVLCNPTGEFRAFPASEYMLIDPHSVRFGSLPEAIQLQLFICDMHTVTVRRTRASSQVSLYSFHQSSFVGFGYVLGILL